MRIQTRGRDGGPCNLCGAVARLTEDHIPPKGVPRVPGPAPRILTLLPAVASCEEHVRAGLDNGLRKPDLLITRAASS